MRSSVGGLPRGGSVSALVRPLFSGAVPPTGGAPLELAFAHFERPSPMLPATARPQGSLEQACTAALVVPAESLAVLAAEAAEKPEGR